MGLGFFQSDGARASQFWKGLHAIKKWVKNSVAYQLGDGRKIKFWQDVWCGQVPLRVCFPLLYSCCEEPEELVSNVLMPGGLNLRFRRSFGPRKFLAWNELRATVENQEVNNIPDVGRWGLERNGIYSSRSLYLEICNPGVRDTRIMEL